MPTTITYLGHSAIMIKRGATTLLIDPFITGNPVATVKASELKPTHIAVTHGHADHVGDTVGLAKASGATVYCNFELGEHFLGLGVKAVEQFNPGGQVGTSFGSIACTKAFHSSSIDGSGKYMGQPNGIVARFNALPGMATATGKLPGEPAFTAYHCGDTDLFGDMALIGEIYKPDVAFIPIGDRFTMGPMLATRAAELIKPRVAVPIHYNTWPPIAVDVGEFRPRGVEVKVMRVGEAWDVA